MEQIIKKIWKKYLVFQIPSDKPVSIAETEDVLIFPVSRDSIGRVFADHRLKRVFLQKVEGSWIGYMGTSEGSWVCYGWMSPENADRPAHLLDKTVGRERYWISYCYTVPDFRGRGLYKAIISRLVLEARKMNAGAKVYIDSELDNIPSHKAILDVGFQEAGIITSFRVPKIGIICQRWEMFKHPPLYVDNKGGKD